MTYWSDVADEKLGYLRKQARQVNPKFELFTNGFHAVNADYFMIEAESHRFKFLQSRRRILPGVYLPYDPPVTIRRGSEKTTARTH